MKQSHICVALFLIPSLTGAAVEQPRCEPHLKCAQDEDAVFLCDGARNREATRPDRGAPIDARRVKIRHGAGSMTKLSGASGPATQAPRQDDAFSAMRFE